MKSFLTIAAAGLLAAAAGLLAAAAAVPAASSALARPQHHRGNPGAHAAKAAPSGPAKPLDADAINDAAPAPEQAANPADPKSAEAKPAERTLGKAASKAADPLLVRAQVLLDRAHFSPGAIDGREGDNYKGALAAFATSQELPGDGGLTPDLWGKLAAASTEPAVTTYAVTEDDAKTKFVERIPAKMEEQADLERMGYRSAAEMLAERFHMSQDLLRSMNPGKDLGAAGTQLLVANVAPLPASLKAPKDAGAKGPDKVARIEVDKGAHRLQAFAEDGRLLGVYPASIGSTEKPAPSGSYKVERVAFDPTYTYNPKYAFKGVSAQHKFTIKPGPNNPVGVVWIDLSAEGYGIHGTPEPDKVGKTASHGCIRLTNWDARGLAERVERGAAVDFKD